MKQLPDTFAGRTSCKNQIFTKVKGTPGIAYIYSKVVYGKTVYEVFRHKEYKEREVAGHIFPAKVAYPSDAAFGSWAWTYDVLGRAEEKYSELCTPIAETHNLKA